MWSWALARAAWCPATVGLASASRLRIAKAWPYDSRALVGSPVCLNIPPMLIWLLARSDWYPSTAGFASARRLRIDNALLNASRALAGSPILYNRPAVLLWLSARSTFASFEMSARGKSPMASFRACSRRSKASAN